MNAIKTAFLALFAAIWSWMKGLWAETETLGVRLWDHARSFAMHVVSAVVHVALIPIRWVQWVWGCVAASGRAIAGIFKKSPQPK